MDTTEIIIAIITAFAGIITTIIVNGKSVKKSNSELLNRLCTGLCNIYAREIECTYEKYTKRGVCPEYVRKYIAGMYDDCKKNGWNGEIGFMVDTLLTLPTAPPQKNGD